MAGWPVSLGQMVVRVHPVALVQKVKEFTPAPCGQKEDAMGYYDPPEAPEALRPCRYCDQEMEKEWSSARDSEYVCANS